jgi:hypothetical protein
VFATLSKRNGSSYTHGVVTCDDESILRKYLCCVKAYSYIRALGMNFAQHAPAQVASVQAVHQCLLVHQCISASSVHQCISVSECISASVLTSASVHQSTSASLHQCSCISAYCYEDDVLAATDDVPSFITIRTHTSYTPSPSSLVIRTHHLHLHRTHTDFAHMLLWFYSLHRRK